MLQRGEGEEQLSVRTSGQDRMGSLDRALGENKTYTDRNGSVHTYSYDVVGRMTADAVTTLASGVNGAIRRLETAYASGGWAYLFTSYDAASGGNVVNQVQRDHNGLGQVIKEYQGFLTESRRLVQRDKGKRHYRGITYWLGVSHFQKFEYP